MLALNSTTMKVRITTGSAGDIEIAWSGVDKTGTGPASYSFASVPASVPANISTATTADLVPVPAASTERNVEQISVANNHASSSNDITVELFDGTNSAVLWKGTLLAQERVQMTEAGEWIVYSAAGTPKIPSNAVDVQVFTATGAGTWTKPTSFVPKFVQVVMYGGGGGGTGGHHNATPAVVAGAAGGATQSYVGGGGGAVGSDGASPTAGAAG